MPLELMILNARTISFNLDNNDKSLRDNLELSMERREIVAIRQENYKK